MNKRLLEFVKFCKSVANEPPGTLSRVAVFGKHPVPCFQYLSPHVTHIDDFNEHSDLFYLGICLIEKLYDREILTFNSLDFDDDDETILFPSSKGIHPPDFFIKETNELLGKMLGQGVKKTCSLQKIALEIQKLFWTLYDFETEDDQIWTYRYVVTDEDLLGNPEVHMANSYFALALYEWKTQRKNPHNMKHRVLIQDFLTYLQKKLDLKTGIFRGNVRISPVTPWQKSNRQEMVYILIEKDQKIWCMLPNLDQQKMFELDDSVSRLFGSGFKPQFGLNM